MVMATACLPLTRTRVPTSRSGSREFLIRGAQIRRSHEPTAGPSVSAPGRRAATPGLSNVLAVQRPTFDMSVLRAALDPERARHDDAVRLLTPAATGILESEFRPQRARADFRGDMATPQARRVLDVLNDRGVVELRQLAVPSTVTLPGPACGAPAVDVG